jgi:hypothetical protein
MLIPSPPTILIAFAVELPVQGPICESRMVTLVELIIWTQSPVVEVIRRLTITVPFWLPITIGPEGFRELEDEYEKRSVAEKKMSVADTQVFLNRRIGLVEF